MSAAAIAPSAASRGTPSRPRGARPLARRRGGGVDPVAGPPSCSTRGGRRDPREALQQLGVALRQRAEPVQRAAIADDEQVVGRSRVGIEANAVHADQEVIERRHRIAADQRRASAVMLHDRGDPERRTERVGIGVLVACHEDVAPRGDGARGRIRDGVEPGRQVHAHGRFFCAPRRDVPPHATARIHCVACHPATHAVRARGGGDGPARQHRRVRADRGHGSGHRPHAGGVAWASAATRRDRRRIERGSLTGLELGEELEDAGTASAVSSTRTWSSGMRRRWRRPPSSWRTNGIACCSARPSVALRRLADDADPHARGARGRAPSRPPVTVTNPIRGSWMSRARISPISCRSCSSIRSVRASSWIAAASASRSGGDLCDRRSTNVWEVKHSITSPSTMSSSTPGRCRIRSPSGPRARRP